MERIVHVEGFTLPDGRHIPGGCLVGMNPWVIHREAEVFGNDRDSFVAERWVQKEGEDVQAFDTRAKAMRVCLGRRLATIEIYKLVSTLLTRYEIELEDHNCEMRVDNNSFTYPSGDTFNVKMSKVRGKVVA